MKLVKYIKSLRSLLENHDAGKRFVLGNSSADYDSIMGSILYAFFMTNSMNIMHFPLIDCTQADMALRFETNMVMEKIGIQASDLLYTEMFVDLYKGNHTFCLYDHNERSEISSQALVEIIDHHAIKGQITCPNIITNCASALTLIYYMYHPEMLIPAQSIENSNEICDKFTLFLNKTQKKPLPQQVRDHLCEEIIMYGILLDSYNFDQNQKDRWIGMDIRAVEQIFKEIPEDHNCFTYQQLSDAKTDEKRNLALTLQQQKRKDFKKIDYESKGQTFSIHYSTILLNVRLFIKQYIKQLNQKYPKQKMGEMEIHSFMFAFIDPQVQGKILQKYKLFNAKNQQLLKLLENSLENQANFKKVQEVEGWELWTDPSGKISRKSFDLYLKNFLKTEKTTL